MERRVTISGKYCPGYGYVSTKWEQICAEHEEEFPKIRECHPGTFNVVMDSPYTPPGEAEYRRRARERGQSEGRYGDGNHLSPSAKVIEMNGKTVEAWIYRGGHGDRPLLEVVSSCRLVEQFSLGPGDAVTAGIVEFSEEGGPGMPGPPPPSPGKNVPLT
jgi:CTP-dependent riboflavin kinase